MATYIGTAAAVPVLRRTLPAAAHVPAARRAGHPDRGARHVHRVLSSATARNLIAAAIALAVGAVLYALDRRKQKRDPECVPVGLRDDRHAV